MVVPKAPTPLSTSFTASRWAKANPPADPTTSFANQTVLITGANIGLGFEAAQKFAKLGASKIIFGVRSAQKGRAAKEQIETATGCGTDVIHIYQLDMGSHASVTAFAKRVSTDFEKINVAVLNAGVSPPGYTTSADGWEMTLQVNVISTTQLALLLLPKLKETSKITGQSSSLEFVASQGYLMVDLNKVKTTDSILQMVSDKAFFGLATQYPVSKLLQMWTMTQIASRTLPEEVIVNSCCPGLCTTNLGRDFNTLMQIPLKLAQFVLARTQEEGSRTLVSGTTLGEEGHGGFWSNDSLHALGPLVESEEAKHLSQKLWSEILALLKKNGTEVEAIRRP